METLRKKGLEGHVKQMAVKRMGGGEKALVCGSWQTGWEVWGAGNPKNKPFRPGTFLRRKKNMVGVVGIPRMGQGFVRCQETGCQSTPENRKKEREGPEGSHLLYGAGKVRVKWEGLVSRGEVFREENWTQDGGKGLFPEEEKRGGRKTKKEKMSGTSPVHSWGYTHHGLGHTSKR